MLIKRIVETDEDGIVTTINYSYEDDKLVTVEHGDTEKNVYTYEGDKLIKDEQYYDNEIAASVELKYDEDDKLIEFTEQWFDASDMNGLIYKHSITYNDNNTYTDDKYRSFLGSEFELYTTDVYSINEGNITKIKSETFNYEQTFSYDEKNGIHKNIHAIELFNMLSDTEFGAPVEGNTNNVTSYTEIDEGITYSEKKYEYTYNEQDYPKTATVEYYGETGALEDTSTVEFFYE